MKVIVGLGNPGRKYAHHRHNIGLMVIDAIAERGGVSLTKHTCEALTGKGKIGDEAVLLVKPETFMNLSGQAVRAVASYYRRPQRRQVHLRCPGDQRVLPFARRGGASAGGTRSFRLRALAIRQGRAGRCSAVCRHVCGGAGSLDFERFGGGAAALPLRIFERFDESPWWRFMFSLVTTGCCGFHIHREVA